MKTEFTLEQMQGAETWNSFTQIKIIGKAPEHKPYVVITSGSDDDLFIKDEDLERFAVNILKALNSKRLKK